MTPSRRALVTGASGYVGGQVVPRLLDEGWTVRVLTRRRASMDGKPWVDRVEVAEGDVGSADDMRRALEGVDAAWYLVHSMDDQPDFAERDREAATHLLRGGEGGGRLAHRLPRRPAPGRRGPLAAPGLARRGRPHPARLGRADRGAPGRRRARRRVGVVRHAALPDDAAARDGRAEVARQQDPADRDRRRRHAARRRRQPAARGQPHLRHRRPRGARPTAR